MERRTPRGEDEEKDDRNERARLIGRIILSGATESCFIICSPTDESDKAGKK
jgi:hypothetical protein